MKEVLITIAECEELVNTPGKFEGCNRYIPYYHAIMLDSGADDEEWDEDENNETVTYLFQVEEDDIDLFEELAHIDIVRFYEDDNGFVCEVKVKGH